MKKITRERVGEIERKWNGEAMCELRSTCEEGEGFNGTQRREIGIGKKFQTFSRAC